MGCLTATLPSQSRRKLVFLSLLMLFLETRPWGGWGMGGGGYFSLWIKTSADYCRYDFVLEKYTVISESVRTCSRARALWDKRVKGLHYSFWLCEKNIFYTFYHSDVHESILVLLISSYWFTGLFETEFSDVTSCFVFTKKKKRGGLLIWFISSYFTVKMCHVYLKESTYRPTVWPVAIKYTVFLFVEHFFSVGVAGEIIWLRQ